MQITKNKVITLHYTLNEGAENEPMTEEILGKTPLSFIFGLGQMIPGFEVNLENKETGIKYAFLLSPEEAFRQKKHMEGKNLVL